MAQPPANKPPVKTPAQGNMLWNALKTFWADPRLVPMLNYFLLFCMVMTFGLAGVVVLLVANFHSEKAADWIKGHYEFQIRTFWFGIGPILLTYFLMAFAQKHNLNTGVAHQGLLILMIACLAWTAGRAVLGFNHLFYSRPIPNPKAWLI